MKISSSPVAAPSPLTYGRIGRSAEAANPGSGSAMSVQSSGFLAELSAAAQQHPYGEIRADKVAAARADIAAGRLGTPEDIEATVNAFLMELS